MQDHACDCAEFESPRTMSPPGLAGESSSLFGVVRSCIACPAAQWPTTVAPDRKVQRSRSFRDIRFSSDWFHGEASRAIVHAEKGSGSTAVCRQVRRPHRSGMELACASGRHLCTPCLSVLSTLSDTQNELEAGARAYQKMSVTISRVVCLSMSW